MFAGPSLAAGVKYSPAILPIPGAAATSEAFATQPQNPLITTAEPPIPTFSVDVNNASYAFIRSALKAGQLLPKAAMRTKEMINYFPYSYPRPEGDAAFHTSVKQTATPWNPNTQLLRIALQGQLAKRDKRPPLNLVFLIDTSGSMHDGNKPPLLK